MNNVNFILTPIDKLMDDAITSTAGLHNKLCAYPVVEYIMHSLFLKISGMLEQKMHSIIFEISNNNIDIRYKVLNGEYKGGSTLKDKNKILNELIQQIRRFSDVKLEYNNEEFWEYSIKVISNKFRNSLFKECNLREFQEFEHMVVKLSNQKKKVDNQKKKIDYQKKNLFSSLHEVQDIYEKYILPTRNSLAHNTNVQLNNIPTIADLAQDNYKYNNYFLFFTVFYYIDIVFMNLFKQYIRCINNTYNM